MPLYSDREDKLGFIYLSEKLLPGIWIVRFSEMRLTPSGIPPRELGFSKRGSSAAHVAQSLERVWSEYSIAKNKLLIGALNGGGPTSISYSNSYRSK